MKGNLIMIRRWQEECLKSALKVRRGVHLTGARQSGKTTLAESIPIPSVVRRSLDKASLVRAAKSDPELFVRRTGGETLVIDEIQKVPELLDEIKIKVDHDNSRGQYLLTGSSNLRFVKSVKDSLAGRFGTVRLRTLALGEINGTPPDFLEQVFQEDFRRVVGRFDKPALVHAAFCGGYPEVFELPYRDRKQWFRGYVGDLLTKDVSDVTELRKADALRAAAMWLLAHTSQLFTIDDFCAKTGLARQTAQTYILALTSLYLFDKVPAWVKSDYDKIGRRAKYIAADAALPASLLGWNEEEALFDDRINGKLAETWVYHELAAHADVSGDYEITHYRDSDKREIDFIVERDDGATAGIEVKCGSSVGDCDFKHLKWFSAKFHPRSFVGIVLYSGDDVLGFGEHLYAVPFANLAY